MNKVIFVLFGKDTLEEIGVSYGGLYRESWSLQQHPGPSLLAKALGGRQDRSCYLYPQHLELLYARFGQANPGGVELGSDSLIEHKYSQGMSPDIVEQLYEKRKMFVALESTDEDLGYPHLKPYLPEIFAPEMVAIMQADPWLNARLLVQAIAQGDVPDRRDFHPRWSQEWRSYCDDRYGRRGWSPPGQNRSL